MNFTVNGLGRFIDEDNLASRVFLAMSSIASHADFLRGSSRVPALIEVNKIFAQFLCLSFVSKRLVSKGFCVELTSYWKEQSILRLPLVMFLSRLRDNWR